MSCGCVLLSQHNSAGVNYVARAGYIVVGLGNPGSVYAATRHNIGFMVIDAFVAAHKGVWKHGKLADTCEITLSATRVLAVKPLTYMNLSGKAAAHVAHELSVPASRVIAITDEYNFPTGRIHLKRGGSDGGHNGISSMIEELRTPEFWRMRCGIDRKFGPGQLVEYVLAPFPEEEREAVELMIRSAVVGLDECIRSGPEIAMNRINRA